VTCSFTSMGLGTVFMCFSLGVYLFFEPQLKLVEQLNPGAGVPGLANAFRATVYGMLSGASICMMWHGWSTLSYLRKTTRSNPTDG
jgi:hypothetical protein